MFIKFCKSEETLLLTREVKLRFFLNAFVSFIRIVYILTRWYFCFLFFNRFKFKRNVTTIIEALDIYARISARKHTNNINRTKPFPILCPLYICLLRNKVRILFWLTTETIFFHVLRMTVIEIYGNSYISTSHELGYFNHVMKTSTWCTRYFRNHSIVSQGRKIFNFFRCYNIFIFFSSIKKLDNSVWTSK